MREKKKKKMSTRCTIPVATRETSILALAAATGLNKKDGA
jgi:hypothetical protein